MGVPLTWFRRPVRERFPDVVDQRLTTHGEELARLLADGDPTVVVNLRIRHVAGEDGRCRGCHASQTPVSIWPCLLRNLADRAARLCP